LSKSQNIIGRVAEKSVLDRVLSSRDPELVALYGRRRVGKTFLVREHLKDYIVFEVAGIHDQSTGSQLAGFHAALRRSFPNIASVQPTNWLDAFEILRSCLEAQAKQKRKQVVFFDEFPWFATRKSNFLAAFDHFWNSYASRRRDLAVVICGSAAAWMIRNIVNARGGLHNRLTHRMRLEPFHLHEVELYLQSRKIHWDRKQLTSLYMAFGGIPHYLNLIRTGQSASECIDAECFRPEGMLRSEYHNLYAALFESYQTHEAIVKTLAMSHSGLTRDQLIERTNLTSGGGFTKAIEELVLSGFVTETHALDKKTKSSLLRLTDEFSVFYWDWMHSNTAANSWMRQATSRRYESWCGCSFESVCFKHLKQLQIALGIADVDTHVASWRYSPKKNSKEEGAQIDLVLDRADQCIHLCEIKFADKPFTITKSYAELLERKLRVFHQYSGRRQTVFLTLITPYGLSPNRYSEQLVAKQVTLKDLFVSK
jgi:hypothetical protein